jgi:ribosomal protein S18 acetylase RimI-like enzyme
MIASLVVHPSHQRQGIARLLLTEALKRYEDYVVTVSTGAKNLPAVRLYQDLGFVEYARCTVGPEALELVKLRRWYGDLG